MDRSLDDVEWTEEQLAAAEKAKKYPWDFKSKPTKLNTVQLANKKLDFKWIDWWNTRSDLFCCCFPLAHCVAGDCNCCCPISVIDSTDASVWKEQLNKTSSSNNNNQCPESMKGVWWLKYNIAHETLVTFSDSEWVGTFNKEGTDGYGTWSKELRYNWSRDQSAFGYGLQIFGGAKTRKSTGFVNMKDGLWLIRGEDDQLAFRISDDEWWKVTYNDDTINSLDLYADDEDNENTQTKEDENVKYMYAWVKVLDKHGAPTKHWAEYERWAKGPLPHENCGTSWFPCWGLNLSASQAYENMTRPNRKQIVWFRN